MEQDKKLSDKLGIKLNQTTTVLYAPKSYEKVIPITFYTNNISELNNKCEWIQAFYSDIDKFENEIKLLADKLSYTGQLWISWPKKTSNIKSNLNDQIVRNFGLSAGLVDVKVASINDDWSGLKFVYRLSERKS